MSRKEEGAGGEKDCEGDGDGEGSAFCRKEKRKLAKKLKRKQIRKEIALKEREEEEARLNDEEEQRKLLLKEKEEAEMMEKQRKEFEERERLWMERIAEQKALEEEEANRILLEEEESQRNQVGNERELSEDDDWEYVEEGPAEIIWQGNEIIVKKKRVKVPKRGSNQQDRIEDADRPTSNPLLPQAEVYASYRNTSVSSQQVFESVSQQNPNFGTEQDKAHCPFHIKTGACRFGVRCSRAHFYPDKSCTLLMKNMYTGPGLAWEQDEGLECTDEEIDHSYEEFYEDVHTEFLKFGEIVNFKVCKNGSFHLRGNVYVHYKSLESAVLAYDSINGRYFAGKQITCEYVGVTRWRVAICGEYMKSRLKTCSRGTACNFIHCFRNPGGDYEWADWDNPPPKYWMKKMAALFGPSDEVEYYDKPTGQESAGFSRNSKKISRKNERYNSRRSRSKDSDTLTNSSGGDDSDGKRERWSTSSNKKKYSAHNRKVRGYNDGHERREDDTDFESDGYGEKDVLNGNGENYRKDTDRHYSRSRANSHRHSKRHEHPDSCKDRREYSGDERYEEKDRLCYRDSHREYDDSRSQRKSHSSSWGRGTGQIKTEDVHDQHVESEKFGNDSPQSHDRRRKSRNLTPGPIFSETVDPCDRWETGSSFLDESKNTRNHGFDGNEPCDKRHIIHDKSSGRRRKIQQEERDSSDAELHSREDHEHSGEKHKKHKTLRNAEESREGSGVEKKEACDNLKHNSGDRSPRRSSHLEKERSKRSRDRTKRKHGSVEKDETRAVPIELEGVSSKRSRSRLSDRHRRRSSKGREGRHSDE